VIGFIGGGIIFMRRDVVRGLTTAASVWFTAALGMACGAGLPILAVATTLGHFVIMFIFPQLERRLPRARRRTTEIYLSYEDGRDLLRTILIKCTELRFAIDHVRLGRKLFFETHDEGVDMTGREDAAMEQRPGKGSVTIHMQIRGKRPVSHLIAALSDIDGVREVGTMNEVGELDESL
jgi:putative Mg2+ transporter-C (MgtC) family protein